MASLFLKKGGPYRWNFNGISKQEVYDTMLRGTSSRIANEYHGGCFTAGNSFNPMFSIGQAEAIDKFNPKVGDFLALFDIPPEHLITDVAVKVIPSQANRGYPSENNSAGFVFTVEVRLYDADMPREEPVGVVELTSPLTGIPGNVADMKRSSVKPTDGGYFLPQNQFAMLGLKIESLPTKENVKLSDLTSRVEVTAHVFDYEAPIHI